MAETTYPKAEVGQWMADCAIGEWYGYDDYSTFDHTREEVDGDTVYTVTDGDEEKSVTFTATEFYNKHRELIYEGKIDNYRLDWIAFATRLGGADTDEYDANTTDAVLQNMLYGEVVYG